MKNRKLAEELGLKQKNTPSIELNKDNIVGTEKQKKILQKKMR